MSRWILRLYPRRWRERYEDELDALLEDAGVGLATMWDLLRGAVDAHVHRGQWSEGGVMSQSPARRWSVLVPTALLAFPLVFLVLLSVNGFGNGMVVPQLTGFFGNPVVEGVTVAGPFLAFAWSAAASTRVSFPRGSHGLQATVRMTLAHGLVLLASAAMIAVYLTYYLVER